MSLFTSVIGAVPGDLDRTFNASGAIPGTRTIEIGSESTARGVAIQADGKIVVAGYTYDDTDSFAIVRLNPDGSMDGSFGSSGVVTLPVGDGGSYAYAVALQADGKIVVAGRSYSEDYEYDGLTVARLSAVDGSLDGSFGTGGIAMAFPGGSSTAYSVAIQGDGKIVVAGEADIEGYRFVVARFESNGALDNSFGTSGIEFVDFEEEYSLCRSVALQSDGKILLAGESYDGSIEKFAIARLSGVDGSPDNSFGGSGKMIFPLGSDSSYCYTVLFDAINSKILLGGYAFLDGTSSFAALRLNMDGSPDNTFGSSGEFLVVAGESSRGYSMTQQADGKIILGGRVIFDEDAAFCVLRVNVNGTLDHGFGVSGVANVAIGSSDRIYGLAIQPADQKIVAVGRADIDDYWFAIARFINEDEPTVAPKFSIFAWLKTVYAEELGYAPDQMNVAVLG